MTKKEYMAFHKDCCERMVSITQAKNADYSGSGDDPFANFRHVANFVQTKELDMVAVGFLTRMSDKFSRIGSFISNGTLQVKDESVLDTLLDLANYSVLMAGYLSERRNAEKSLVKPE